MIRPVVGAPGRRFRADPVDEAFGPGDPYPGADPGLQRQAGPGPFGRLAGAAQAPGEAGQQAVDGAPAVGAHTDDGELTGVRRQLLMQPPRVRLAERDGDLGPVGDRLDPGPRPRRRREPAGHDLARRPQVAAQHEAQRGGRSGEMGHGWMVRPGDARGQLLGLISQSAGDQQLGALVDETGRLAPRAGHVRHGPEGVLGDLGAPLDVPGNDVAARLREPQLGLQLGRVEHAGGERPGRRELGVEPGELPGADQFCQLAGAQQRLNHGGEGQPVAGEHLVDDRPALGQMVGAQRRQQIAADGDAELVRLSEPPRDAERLLRIAPRAADHLAERQLARQGREDTHAAGRIGIRDTVQLPFEQRDEAGVGLAPLA
jgi:hypothetical protein